MHLLPGGRRRVSTQRLLAKGHMLWDVRKLFSGSCTIFLFFRTDLNCVGCGKTCCSRKLVHYFVWIASELMRVYGNLIIVFKSSFCLPYSWELNDENIAILVLSLSSSFVSLSTVSMGSFWGLFFLVREERYVVENSTYPKNSLKLIFSVK